MSWGAIDHYGAWGAGSFPPAEQVRWSDPYAPGWTYDLYSDGTIVIRTPVDHAGKKVTSGAARAAVISRYQGHAPTAATAEPSSGAPLALAADIAGRTGTEAGGVAASILSAFGVSKGEGLKTSAAMALAYAPGAILSLAEKKAAQKGDVGYLKAQLSKKIAKYYKTKSASKRAKLKQQIAGLQAQIRALSGGGGGRAAPTVSMAPAQSEGPPMALLLGGGALVLGLVVVVAMKKKKGR